MNTCTCKADTEAKLLAEFVRELPGATSHRVSIEGYTNTIGASPSTGYFPYTESAIDPRYTHGKSSRFREGKVHFLYCPFCGLKGALT